VIFWQVPSERATSPSSQFGITKTVEVVVVVGASVVVVVSAFAACGGFVGYGG
jgi:hypothetical protein